MKMFFQCFCEKLNEQSIVGLALGCKRKIEDKKNLIGSRIVRKRKSENLKVDSQNCHYKEIILDGVAFYWKGNDVSYMSLDDRSLFPFFFFKKNILLEYYLHFF